MSELFDTTVLLNGDGRGLIPRDTFASATNRTGGELSKGDIVMFDIGQSATEVTNNNVQDPASGLSNVILPQTGQLGHGIFAVADETIADNANGRFRLTGVCNVKANKNSGGISLYDPLIAQNGAEEADADTSGGAKIIAIALEAVDNADVGNSPAQAATLKVLFNANGLGSVNTTS